MNAEEISFKYFLNAYGTLEVSVCEDGGVIRTLSGTDGGWVLENMRINCSTNPFVSKPGNFTCFECKVIQIF